MTPAVQSALSDSVPELRTQAALSDLSPAERIKHALAGRDAAWLSRETGISTSTLSDVIAKGKMPRADRAIKIARALASSVEWLFGGIAESRPSLIEASSADWVDLPRFDLRDLTEAGKGAPVEAVPFRRDWLNRRILTSVGLWITELPSDYDSLDLAEGDAVICSDIAAGAGPQENWVCIFRSSAGPFVARYRHRDVAELVAGEGDVIVSAAQLHRGELFPIARIHARLLARL